MKILACFALLLLAKPAFCLTKTEAVRLSKARIQTLSTTFASFSYNCFMFDQECGIEDLSQIATLKWISTELSVHPAQILYDSGREKFWIDGAVRIAKTGSQWGTPVIFNEDMLAVEVSSGQFEALGFFEIVGILVHEFGHHQEKSLAEFGMRALEHHDLDLMSMKVVGYLKDRTRRLQISRTDVPSLAPDAEVNIYQIDIEWYNGIRNIWSRIFVDGLSETKEISSTLFSSLRCPVTRTPEGHITFKGQSEYVSFRKIRAPSMFLVGPRLQVIQEVGEASVLCVDSRMQRYEIFSGYTDGVVTLEFDLTADGLLKLSPTSSFRATPPKDQVERH